MRKALLTIVSLLAALLLALMSARAEWPQRVFAPYMYLGADDQFKLTDCDDACGLKHYTLAFIIAAQQGQGKDVHYSKQPAWDGRWPMEENRYLDQIEAIRGRGGDVICSFGGEAGRELAIVEEDPVALQAAYQAILDRYHFTWLDFDIEGSNLEKNPEASRRRNTAVAGLQQKNPGLRISYTLPVDPDGLRDPSLALLADAKTKGIKVYSANLMVMFFGKRFINKGRSEGELGIDSAKTAYAQIQKIDPSIRIGLCPCLGNNGSKEEVFTLADARTLKAFADATPWVCSLHFWSINDDAARPRRRRSATQPSTQPDAPRQPWAFANIFKSFTTATP
jgi:chitinase